MAKSRLLNNLKFQATIMCTFGASDLCMIRFRKMKAIRVSELKNDSTALATPHDFFSVEAIRFISSL